MPRKHYGNKAPYAYASATVREHVAIAERALGNGKRVNQCKRCISDRVNCLYRKRHVASDNLCECGCGHYTFVSGLTGVPCRFLRGHSFRSSSSRV